uniref:39K seed protein (Fragments) n=1 Tax=Hordeum vulgare TaxID=4513 RepID=Q7M273_HORVU
QFSMYILLPEAHDGLSRSLPIRMDFVANHPFLIRED